MRYYIWVVLSCLIYNTSVGQTYHGSSFLYDVYSANHTNPAAHITDKKITIFLPEVFIATSNSGPNFSQLFAKRDNDTYVIDKEQSVAHVHNFNNLHASVYLNTIGASYRIDNISFSAGHAMRGIGYGGYTKELLQTYVNGNAQFIGQQINLSPKLLVQNFHQYSFGVSYEKDKLDIGVRVKYLSGIQDLSTDNTEINLTTGETYYDLQFQNDFLINTSSVLTYDDLSNVAFDFDGNVWKRYLSNNRGIAFDIGAEYEISNSLLISAAIYDLGKIRWARDVRNYKSDTTYTYAGIDIIELIDIDNEYELSDTLNNLLQLTKSYDTYSTTLPVQLEVGAKYFVNDRLSANAVVNYLSVQDEHFLSCMAAVHYRLIEQAKLSASVGYINNQAFAIGIGGNFNIGMFRFFINTNHIIGLTNPLDRSFANLHAGANFSF